MATSNSWPDSYDVTGSSGDEGSGSNFPAKLKTLSGKGQQIAKHDSNANNIAVAPPHSRDGTPDIDATCNPFRGKDVTVHLTLDIQEDLEMPLERLSRFTHLGDFRRARALVEQELREHLDRPYVLVKWAETLLKQGDYKSMAELDWSPMRDLESYAADNKDAKLLVIYWKLMHLEERAQRMVLEDSSADWRVLDDVLGSISDYAKLTSIEINILASFSRLVDTHPAYAMLCPKLDAQFTPSAFEGLYNELVKEGRVWDLCALFTIMFANRYLIDDRLEALLGISDGRQLLPSLVAHWEMPEYDESTNLALLEIVSGRMMGTVRSRSLAGVSIQALGLKLAQCIVQKDPASTKSAPFLTWVLASTVLEERKHGDAFQSVWENLRSSKGIAFMDTPIPLPKYIPIYGDNPGWKMEDADAKFRDTLKLVVNACREMCNYELESQALEQLIRLSAHPEEAFEQLCHLEKHMAESKWLYEDKLITGYLIYPPQDLARKLKPQIAEHLDSTRPFISYHTSFTENNRWILSMLLYALEDRQEEADKTLRQAEHEFQFISNDLRELVGDKFTPSARLMSGHNDTNTRSRRYDHRHPPPSSPPPADHASIWEITTEPSSRRGTARFTYSPLPLPPPTQLRPRSRSHQRRDTDIRTADSRRSRPRSPTPERGRTYSPPEMRRPRSPSSSNSPYEYRRRGGRRYHASTSRSPSPPPPPRVIKGPIIEREVITHYRDIDHGITQADQFTASNPNHSARPRWEEEEEGAQNAAASPSPNNNNNNGGHRPASPSPPPPPSSPPPPSVGEEQPAPPPPPDGGSAPGPALRREVRTLPRFLLEEGNEDKRGRSTGRKHTRYDDEEKEKKKREAQEGKVDDDDGLPEPESNTLPRMQAEADKGRSPASSSSRGRSRSKGKEPTGPVVAEIPVDEVDSRRE